MELPGADLVVRGPDDLRSGLADSKPLLVSMGSSRLRSLGLGVSEPFPAPEIALYALLKETAERVRE